MKGRLPHSIDLVPTARVVMAGESSLARPDFIDSSHLQKMRDAQKWYQQQQAQKGFVHLIGKNDRITNIVVPGALSAVAGYFLINGLYHLYTGTGRSE
ncbi:hypothetical protein WJX72_008382 [[Myrmecia] bisecta]|uniref:Uncharacterized protein n=1 Tax=[Myrmecia] bisecta TaxID=41462 RepID=A0AAW1PDG4_9CHLO